MGGGAVLRGLGRAIGVGGASVRGGIGSCSQQVAKVAEAKASVSSSSSCYVAGEEEGFVDDWEFAGEEEGEGLQTRHHQVQLDEQPLVRERIIFGTVPTTEEVLEASSDLQDFIKQTITPVSDTFDQESVSSSFSSVHDKPNSVEVSNMQDSDNRYSQNLVNQVEPEFGQHNDKMLQKSGYSNVVEAFSLFQSNPSVQGMANSLAVDKAVWEVLLKNEKVLEFRQQLLKDESELRGTNRNDYAMADESELPETNMNDYASADESELPETNKDIGKPSPGKHPFVKAFETVKAKVVEYMDRITKLCNQFFGVADKGHSDKDSEFVKALKASWMLCIAILLIVLIKRI